MIESGYFKHGNFREYSYFAGANFAVLKREFPVAIVRRRWRKERLIKLSMMMSNDDDDHHLSIPHPQATVLRLIWNHMTIDHSLFGSN